MAGVLLVSHTTPVKSAGPFRGTRTPAILGQIKCASIALPDGPVNAQEYRFFSIEVPFASLSQPSQQLPPARRFTPPKAGGGRRNALDAVTQCIFTPILVRLDARQDYGEDRWMVISDRNATNHEKDEYRKRVAY